MLRHPLAAQENQIAIACSLGLAGDERLDGAAARRQSPVVCGVGRSPSCRPKSISIPLPHPAQGRQREVTGAARVGKSGAEAAHRRPP